MLKKVLLLSIIAIALIGLTAAGTRAFFSDTETSSGNTVASGTLNLQVGANDPTSESIYMDNIKPTDSGSLAAWEISNTGSVEGMFYVSVNVVANYENDCSEVEEASGDDPLDDEGELGELLTLAMWMDNDSDGDWTDGDYYLDPSGSGLVKIGWAGGSTLPSGAYFIVNAFSQKDSGELQSIQGGSTAGKFTVDLIFPDNGILDNWAQSDSCVFDIEFSLVQAP